MGVGHGRELADRTSAQRAERQRLADALHDGPLQLLLAARQDAEEAAAGDHDLLPALAARIGEAGTELRALVSSMHEDTLDGASLQTALERIADEAARRGRFTAAVQVGAAAGGHHDALVRDTARELLQNVARHAEASHVGVEVAVLDEELVLRVADDGVGADAAEMERRAAEGHVGLARVRRGAEALGGVLQVTTTPGLGTTVVVAWPVSALVAQRTLERQLQADQRWTAAIASTVQDGVLVLRDGLVAEVNDALVALVGHPREALLGTPAPWPFWPPHQADDLVDLLAATARDGRAEGTHRIRRADGTQLLVHLAAAILADGPHERGGTLVTLKDLSERLREEERARLQAELRTTIGTTRRLTAILAAVPHGAARVYAALGDALGAHLGWQDVVVNRQEPDGSLLVVWTSGPELDATLLGARYAPADFADALAPRFERAGTFFSPEEAHVEIQGPAHEVAFPVDAADAGAWRPGDLLLVPMRAPDGGYAGLLSVDRPASRRRPSDTELAVLAEVAAHAALALALATG